MRKAWCCAVGFPSSNARYSMNTRGRHMLVTVEDRQGHRSVKEYVGTPGRRIKVLDDLGRVCPK